MPNRNHHASSCAKSDSVSLGLSTVDRCKISLEHNVPLGTYMIYTEKEHSCGAAEEASIQRKVLDNRLSLSQERVKSFCELTEKRAKSDIGSKQWNSDKPISTDGRYRVHQSSSDFEDAFHKVSFMSKKGLHLI